MHGLWAYAEIVNVLAVSDEDNLWFNFYTPTTFTLNGVTFTVETDYPQDSRILIRCERGETAQIQTHIRIPHWAEKFAIKINGKKVKGTFADNLVTFQQQWKKGDTLTLELPLSLRLVDGRGNDLLKRRKLDDHPVRASFFYGPLLLGADTQRGSLPDEIFFDASKNYQIKGKAKPFALLNAHFMIPSVSGNFQSATTLVPISEQTGYMEWTDEWRDFRRNSGSPLKRTAVQYIHDVKIEK